MTLPSKSSICTNFISKNDKEKYTSGISNNIIISLQEDSNAIVEIHGHYDKYGIITSCNCPFQALFCYPQSKLIGSNVEIIIPEIFQEKHRTLLVTSNCKQFDEEDLPIVTYGKNASQNIFQVRIKLSKYINISEEPIIVGKLERCAEKSTNALLLVSPSGVVLHCNSCRAIIRCKLHIGNHSHPLQRLSDCAAVLNPKAFL